MARQKHVHLVACLLAILTSLVSAGKVTNPRNVPKDAILLSNVETLTLRDGRMTSHRRVSAVPQLTCVGSPQVCKLYKVDVMQCKNQGADYDAENIQWACSASLPEEFKLGGTEVACEGYASSDDPYVLKGSCAVEYRLLLTDEGEKKFGRHHRPSAPSDPKDSSTTFAKVMFFMIFVAVLFIIVAGLVNQCQQNPPRLGGNDNRPPWFGGGGDDEGRGDDPPPYDAHNFGNSRKYKTASSPRNYGTASSSRNTGRQQQGWRPGPWTAGLAGAGLGYAMGRNQNQTRTQPSAPSSSNNGGWFNNGGGAGPSDRRPSSPPSFSSSRYESTGFGGTSRRTSSTPQQAPEMSLPYDNRSSTSRSITTSVSQDSEDSHMSRRDPQRRNRGRDRRQSRVARPRVAEVRMVQQPRPVTPITPVTRHMPRPKRTSLSKPRKKGNFSQTSDHTTLNGSLLQAHCRDAAQNISQSTIDLNDCLSNDFGSFKWERYGNAFSSAADMHLVDGHILEARLNDGRGGWRVSRVDLNEMMENRNGILTFDNGCDGAIHGTTSVAEAVNHSSMEIQSLCTSTSHVETEESVRSMSSSSSSDTDNNEASIKVECSQKQLSPETTKVVVQQSAEVNMELKRTCTSYGSTKRR